MRLNVVQGTRLFDFPKQGSAGWMDAAMLDGCCPCLPFSFASRLNSLTPHEVSLDTPMYRTLPCLRLEVDRVSQLHSRQAAAAAAAAVR